MIPIHPIVDHFTIAIFTLVVIFEIVGWLLKKELLMKPGCQHGGTGDKNLEFLARHGAFNIDGG